MTYHEEELRNLLRLEVASKSDSSCIAFAIFSIFSFYYHFGCVRFALLIQSISSLIFFASIIRFFFCKNLVKEKMVSTGQWGTLIAFIALNSIGWSIIFSTAAFELKFSGIHFVVVTTFVAGFIGASIANLSYFSYLFIPFQVLILFPQIIIVLYYYFSPEHLNFLPLTILYLMYFIYQIKHGEVFRIEILKRFQYQIELEIANRELKESKEELIDQTVKLVHISRLAALGEMSAGIAHEINNPLTIIKGGAQIIEKNIQRDSLDKDSLLKHSIKIQNSINRITKIIKGLKNFSASSENHSKEVASLAEIIRDTLNYCNELLAFHNITLEVADIPDCQLNCHPVQISQVFINLINNARDAILENEFVDQEKWIKMSFELAPTSVMIKFSNGGNKISDEIAHKIFQPFFSTKPMGSGTGLGLSISQKILKDHNGELLLDQSKDFTTFVVVHPLS